MHTRHQWIAAALAVAALAGGAQAARAQLAQKFVTPLGGVPYQDWSIVNYIDLDSSSGVQDWRSGSPAYTYDGHDAIDFTLANFAEMEAGIEVYAAAAGTVTEVVGDRYDYCTAENPCSTGANYITIDHGGGLVTQYLHLRQNSPMVTVGQHVDQGQQIAWVGSSGNSTDPHLHFAVRQNGATVETYLDPEAYWLDPLPYSGDVPGALDFGVADHVPKNDTSATDPKLRSELRYRPEDAKIFLADQANSATMWILLHGLSSDRVQFQWFRPDGSVFDTNSTSSLTIRYGWRTDSITLPSRALGEWKVTATLNPGLSSQQILGTANFNVVLSGDINTDGVLDEADIDAFVAGWLYQQPTGDINSWRKGDLTLDGKVDLSDAFELHQAMLAAGAGALDFSRLVTAPEPSVLLLIGIGVLATSFPRSNSRQMYLYLGKCATPFWPRC